jgi:hypothetical protein
MSNTATANPNRPSLPAAKYVLSTRTLAPTRPTAPTAEEAAVRGVRGSYRILRTDEVDAKDDPLPAAERDRVASTGAPAATRSTGDDFAGSARSAAKLSIATGPVETFADVKALIESLPAKSKMVHHHPPITTESASGRVDEEQRNVRLDAFLYAASRENDNDFHLIVGRDPTADPPTYMTMEVSGLPAADDASFTPLKGVRNAFKAFFGDSLPGASYDFYDPPIPIRVEGSLFFDMSHATGRSPGPPSLHDDMPVIWEVHPISSLVMEP